MEQSEVHISLDDGTAQTLFLSIPTRDVERLSYFPHKWLKFVMFSICGAHGVLSATPGGTAVDDDTTFPKICQSYYYRFLEGMSPNFIDYNGFDERITSTARTVRATDFRTRIMNRDQCCVVTGEKADICDAAHLIPKCKGDAYIKQVVQSRRHLYPQEIEISDIDDVRNGMLLRKDLHAKLSVSNIAFLRTPNALLSPQDIPTEGVMVFPELPYRITMQHIAPDSGRLPPCRDHDAYLIGTADTFPPVVILDFIYGIVAYRHWRSDKNAHEKLVSYFKDHYEPVSRRSPADDTSSDHESKDPTYSLPSKEYLDAMDDVLELSLMIQQRMTPREVLVRAQQKQDEVQLRERDISRMKVEEWRRAISDNDSVKSSNPFCVA